MSWPLIHTLFDHYHHVYLSGRILSYDETSASAPLYYRTILYTCIVPSPTYPNDRPHYSTVLYMITWPLLKSSRVCTVVLYVVLSYCSTVVLLNTVVQKKGKEKEKKKESRKIIRKGRKEGKEGKEGRKEERKDFLLLVLLFGFTRSF